QHGRPLLGRVRRPRRSPTSTLLCRPPTPCPLQPPLRFPLLMAYLDAGALFYAPRGRRHVRPQRAVRRRRVTGSPSRRTVSRRGEGLPGYGTVLFRTCHGRTPRRRHLPPCPEDTYAGGCYGLQVKQDPRPPGRLEVSGPHAPWPTRSHAYASPTTFLGSSQGLLPAQAGSPLAGPGSHPLGDRRSFMKLSSLHSPSTGIAWSHCNSYTR